MMKDLKKVYELLEDEQSKDIFLNRILYNLTRDDIYIDNMFQYELEHLRNSVYIKEIAKKLENLIDNRDVIIYGIGDYGKLLSKFIEYFLPHIKILSFCDRKAKNVSTFLGYPVIDKNTYYLDYKECVLLVSPRYCSEEIVNELLEMHISIENILSSSRNKEILECQLAYICNQYFDDVIRLKENEVFVDGGCFDCSTSLIFRNKCQTYKKIIAFEPDSYNYKKCQSIKTECNIENMDIYNYGMWNSETVLLFQLKGSLGSCISENGNDSIKVIDLDSIMQGENVTFIKMDIEGAELNALKGAKETIQKWKPKLAICIYHKIEDIIEIPLYIHELVPEYKLYIRHYAWDHNETVLYAVID
ncbi:MAG: FkbM family methyltransferase [Lachnospiraceae bacterium]|nr:FkbM family methyltransferase [Lachnospiraceae bacterium]